MKLNKILGISRTGRHAVGADLSCPPPIYRPPAHRSHTLMNLLNLIIGLLGNPHDTCTNLSKVIIGPWRTSPITDILTNRRGKSHPIDGIGMRAPFLLRGRGRRWACAQERLSHLTRTNVYSTLQQTTSVKPGAAMETVRIYRLKGLAPPTRERLRAAQMEAAHVWNLCRELHQ